jgi:hypothetical protein
LADGSTGGNCSGEIGDFGYNLSDDGTCNFSAAGSQNNVTALGSYLGPLGNNGGPTETIAELSGSPSIDAIPHASCTFPSGTLNPCTNPPALTISDQLTCDQRGAPRPDPADGSNGPCDIGAYEYQKPVTFPFAYFSAAVAIKLPNDFDVIGSFRLGPNNPPLNPANQAVTLTLSSAGLNPSAVVSIPTGSFKLVKGIYAYSGKVNGVSIVAAISPLGKNSYGFTIDGQGLNLTGITNPVTVTLQIGSNIGSATGKALITK